MTASVLLAVELHEDLGKRTVVMLNGDEVPEVPLIEPED